MFEGLTTIMGIRQFDWRDLPVLLRYRKRGNFFDSATVLTRGEMLVPLGAMLSYFAPATGIFTYLCSDEENKVEDLLGQVTHNQEHRLSRLLFLAPEAALEADLFANLLEHIIQQVGKRGAFHLRAEVEDGSASYENLRRAGFAPYVHQRIWKSPPNSDSKSNPSQWRDITGRDVIPIRSLYNSLVPPLVQQVESFPLEKIKGQTIFQEDEIKGFAEIRYGQRGIWIHPFIHPETREVQPLLADLLANLPNRHSRPIYMCVRSYQSWLENYLEDLQASAGPTQAVMVKHLAVAQQVKSSFSLPALEGGQQEITTPFMRSQRNNL